MRKHLSAVVLLCATATLLHAQGVVTGTVIDDLGDPAYGATVVVVGSDPIIGTTTDFDGKYRIEVPPTGGLTDLKFSYIGLGDKTVEGVVVEEGEVTFLDVALDEAGVELEEVVVTAQALQNTDVAITKIRAGSDKILDGISSQEMSRLSLSDAASALTKVTGTTIVDGKFIVVRGLGDRYSTAQLNGLEMPSTDPYRNSPQLDLIPSSLLDNIITSKTFTPDQPGSFTGGNVNLQTKNFPDQRTISASVSVGYNTLATFNDDFLRQPSGANDYWGYDDGTRALPQRLVEIGDNPVVIQDFLGRDREINPLSPTVQTIAVGSEGAEPLFAAVEEAADLLPTDFTLRRSAPTLNHSYSFTYGDRYDLGGDRQIGFVFNAKFDRDYSHYDNGTTALYTVGGAGATALNPFFVYDDTRSVENPTVGLFGTTSLRLARGHTISLLGVYSHNTQITARRLDGIAPGYNIESPDIVENTVFDFLERGNLTGQLHGEHALNASGDFKLDWAASVTESTQNTPNLRFLSVVRPGGPDGTPIFRQNEFGLPSNFFRELEDTQGEVKLDLAKDFAGGHKAQIGGSYRNKERDFDEWIYETFYVQRNANSRISDGVEPFFADENTGVITTEDGDQLVSNIVNEITDPRNSYDGTETISAAYAMGTIQIVPKLRAVVGARLEHTDLFVASQDTSEEIGEIVETNLLPSFNLIYSPRENHNLRASFTQTLARPNMREIAIFPAFEFSGGPRFSGNPELVLTTVDNYDLRYEIFPEAGGILSASGFYKNFTNPIVSTFIAGTGEAPFIEPVNVESAQVYGVELEARHPIDFGYPQLAGLSAGANLSLIESESDIDPSEVQRFGLDRDTRQLQGQSPYIVNANIAYTNADFGWDAAVSYNVFGDRLAFNGNNGTPDVFERGRQSLDATIAKDIGDFTVRAVAQNLLNPEYETFAEFEGQDFIYSQFQRGRTFKLSVGYTFRQ